MAGRHSPVSRLEGRGRPCTTVERDCESREGPQGVARADGYAWLWRLIAQAGTPGRGSYGRIRR